MEEGTSDFAVDVIRETLRRFPPVPVSPWVGPVGDFVVVDGDAGVTLTTPANRGDGGFIYPAPPGRHPVYAVAYCDPEQPEPQDFRVNELFLPFAPWEQVAEAHWGAHTNDSRGAEVEGCACLWTPRAELAALRLWGDDEGDTIPWIEEAANSADVLTRPGNYPDEVVDPDSGANIIAFPVAQGLVDSHQARNDDGDLLALMLYIDFY